jgi:hypothetical protein
VNDVGSRSTTPARTASTQPDCSRLSLQEPHRRAGEPDPALKVASPARCSLDVVQNVRAPGAITASVHAVPDTLWAAACPRQVAEAVTRSGLPRLKSVRDARHPLSAVHADAIIQAIAGHSAPTSR